MRKIHFTEYPFVWLDEVIETTLDPSIFNVDIMKGQEAAKVTEQFGAECRNVWTNLKIKLFQSRSIEQTMVVSNQYYTETLHLQNVLQQHYEKYLNPDTKTFVERLLKILAGLAEKIKRRHETCMEEQLFRPVTLKRAARYRKFYVSLA